MSSESAIAVDIETISPNTDDPNPQNPDDLELLCIGVGYREHNNAPVETHVLMRRGLSPRHEIELLDRLYEWVLTHRAEKLLTYNGTKFDIVHLRGRADRADRSCETDNLIRDKIDSILEVHRHVDLFDTARDVYDFWPKLEQVCRDYGISVPETLYQGRVVENSIIPRLGEEYLRSIENGNRLPDLHRTLIEYTESDIEPLFHLEDGLIKEN
jgi:uncharacterized protein YprB with RNaseH-like and TPR domain